MTLYFGRLNGDPWAGQIICPEINLPTTLCLMPKISSLKRLLLFLSVKVGLLKGGIAYNIINIQCMFIINLFGVRLNLFFNMTTNNSEGDQLQKESEKTQLSIILLMS